MTWVVWMKSLSLLAFASSTILFLLGARRDSDGARTKPTRRLASALFVLATITLALGTFGEYSGQLWAEQAGPLLVLTLAGTAIVMAWRLRNDAHGVFVAPLATLVMVVQFFFIRTQEIYAPPHTWATLLAGFHVLFAALGQGFAIYAFLLGVLYLHKQRALKRKQLSRLAATGAPALDRVQELLLRALSWGFVLMTASLVTGAIYVDILRLSVTSALFAKIIWALSVWALYLTCLLQQRWFSRPIRETILMSMFGFFALTVTFFGMGFFREIGGP